MSAIDVLAKLAPLQAQQVDPLQRVLLITDGTVTDILETVFLERIQLVKIAQRMVSASQSHLKLKPDPGESMMERQILLRGAQSGRNYVYAESVVAVDRLSSSFREALVDSDTPLGRLWLEHRLETFKELLEASCDDAAGLSAYFNCPPSAQLFARTYRVLSARRPVMTISEYFPISYGPTEDKRLAWNSSFVSQRITL